MALRKFYSISFEIVSTREYHVLWIMLIIYYYSPTGLTTKLPASSGAVSTSVAITVSGSFDGGMKKYDRYPVVCEEQTETGEDDAIFVLKSGATLSNVIVSISLEVA